MQIRLLPLEHRGKTSLEKICERTHPEGGREMLRGYKVHAPRMSNEGNARIWPMMALKDVEMGRGGGGGAGGGRGGGGGML